MPCKIILYFFNILICCSLMLNCFKLPFPPHQFTLHIMKKKKKIYDNFANLLTQSLAEAPLQHLGMMRQALHIIIWQLSAILHLTSSPLKLCQVGWGQAHIFRFLQKYLTGFKSRFWLGHSRTFTELSISHSC